MLRVDAGATLIVLATGVIAAMPRSWAARSRLASRCACFMRQASQLHTPTGSWKHSSVRLDDLGG